MEVEDDSGPSAAPRPTSSSSTRKVSAQQLPTPFPSADVAPSSTMHRSAQSSESMTDVDGSTLHFPPGFVLQLPLAMVQLSGKLGIEFVSVRFGKYSVQLIMSDALHLFIEVEDHGSRLDFIALYKSNDAEARQWLPQVVRVFELAVRLQLWRSGCPLASLETDGKLSAERHDEDDQREADAGRQDDDSKMVSLLSQPRQAAVSRAAPLVCCHFHYPTSSDLLDCEAIPLCGQCVLAAGHHREMVITARAPNPRGPSSSSTPAPLVCRCKRVGHPVSADMMCFDRWSGALSLSPSAGAVLPAPLVVSASATLPAPYHTTAAAVKEVLDDPPELVRRLSFLCKEVKLVHEQLAFVRSKHEEHADQVADQLSQVRDRQNDQSNELSEVKATQSHQANELSAVKARQDDQAANHDALSERVVRLEQRFESFDDSLKDALVRRTWLSFSGSCSSYSPAIVSSGSTGPRFQGSGVQDECASRLCAGQ